MITRRMARVRNEEVIQNDERFKEEAKEEYIKLLKELVFRSFRAAKINYELGSKYDKDLYWLEIASVVITAIVNHNVSCEDNYWLWLGCMIGAVIFTFFVSLIAKTLPGVFPILRKKQKEHTKTAAGWQALAYRSHSCQILMKGPNLSVDEYKDMYEDLLSKREQLEKNVSAV